MSTGPFSRLYPDSSIEVVFAIVCAAKYGNQAAKLDNYEQKRILREHANWAQQAYNGEDINGNNNLDPGEDIAGRDSLGLVFLPDNKLTRYLLPSPPKKPKVHAELSDQSVTLYWDKTTAEKSVDPISGLEDFEGYRVYQSKIGADFQTPDQLYSNLQMVGDFDRLDDSVSHNTGFGRILLDAPKVFPPDTVEYWYRFPPEGRNVQYLNGWQYIFAVTAYDQGDTSVASLESTKFPLLRLVPGTPATSAASDAVGVYPNPYYVNAYWDGTKERLRKIYFYNLPARCTIRIYTLAGDVVAEIQHDASTYDASDVQWFENFGGTSIAPQFAGGEHAWDLISRFDQAIATGLYLFTVEDNSSGEVKRGKFLVIK